MRPTFICFVAISIGALTLNYSLMFEANAQHGGIILDQQQIQLKKNTNRFTQFVTFIGQGIWHILIGFDHILFVVSLMLPVSGNGMAGAACIYLNLASHKFSRAQAICSPIKSKSCVLFFNQTD